MRSAFPLVLLLLVAGCVTSRPAPPSPAPIATPTPAPAPLAADWRDWPVAAGTWRYTATPSGSQAVFDGAGAVPLATLTCDGRGATIALGLTTLSPGPLTVRTSALTRVVTATAAPTGVEMRLPATDPLLDAMAFSRGRFAVSAATGAPVVLPAWAEVGRVIEDCRR